jgi:hypothetical protein
LRTKFHISQNGHFKKFLSIFGEVRHCLQVCDDLVGKLVEKFAGVTVKEGRVTETMGTDQFWLAEHFTMVDSLKSQAHSKLTNLKLYSIAFLKIKINWCHRPTFSYF